MIQESKPGKRKVKMFYTCELEDLSSICCVAMKSDG